MTSAEVRRPTLDDVFLELTGRSLRDAGDIPASASEPSTRIRDSQSTEEAA